nr:unnamed protein product [uncultured bacterium]
MTDKDINNLPAETGTAEDEAKTVILEYNAVDTVEQTHFKTLFSPGKNVINQALMLAGNKNDLNNFINIHNEDKTKEYKVIKQNDTIEIELNTNKYITSVTIGNINNIDIQQSTPKLIDIIFNHFTIDNIEKTKENKKIILTSDELINKYKLFSRLEYLKRAIKDKTIINTLRNIGVVYNLKEENKEETIYFFIFQTIKIKENKKAGNKEFSIELNISDDFIKLCEKMGTVYINKNSMSLNSVAYMLNSYFSEYIRTNINKYNQWKKYQIEIGGKKTKRYGIKISREAILKYLIKDYININKHSKRDIQHYIIKLIEDISLMDSGKTYIVCRLEKNGDTDATLKNIDDKKTENEIELKEWLKGYYILLVEDNYYKATKHIGKKTKEQNK